MGYFLQCFATPLVKLYLIDKENTQTMNGSKGIPPREIIPHLSTLHCHSVILLAYVFYVLLLGRSGSGTNPAYAAITLSNNVTPPHVL